MVAAHARFRRLPGAMRVLAVELCHYLDILITCAAAKLPAAPTPGDPAAADVPSLASPVAAEHGAGNSSAEEQSTAAPTDPAQLAQQLAQTLRSTGDAVPARSDEAPEDDSLSEVKEQGIGVSTVQLPISTMQPGPLLIGVLYGDIVTFVLELLSDADAGAKPAEIAAPLQLHLRFLQIAQWQSIESMPASEPGGASAAKEPHLEQGLSLPTPAVRRFLRVDTPLNRLRSVSVAFHKAVEVCHRVQLFLTQGQ